MFVVTVKFTLHPGMTGEFMPLMQQNAAQSLADEPGCQQFDICCDEARPYEVFLYEVYTSRAAFDDHLASAHFKAFDEAVSAMILSKDVATYRQVLQ
tara:strand:+ start:379 stop:669 length:291 start_codon:yes stop_codon:yes gene_type:complete